MWRVFKGWKGSTKSIPGAIGAKIDVKAIEITSFVLMYIYVKINVYPVKNCT